MVTALGSCVKWPLHSIFMAIANDIYETCGGNPGYHRARITIATSKLIQIKRKGAQIAGLVKLIHPQNDNNSWDFGFWDFATLEEGELDHCDIANKHKSKHTHTNPKRCNDEPHPTSVLLGLHYLQSVNQMLVLIWAPSTKIITIIVITITHYLNSVTLTFTHFINLVTRVLFYYIYSITYLI
jgi:hypothetical protein